MSADDEVLDALTALRDAGLATHRDPLNAAWADLMGKPRPPRLQAEQAHDAPAVLGPCATCGTLHDRYGDHGQPLCHACQEVAQ